MQRITKWVTTGWMRGVLTGALGLMIPMPAPAQAPPPTTAQTPAQPPAQTVAVSGLVLGPDDKPVADATVAITSWQDGKSNSREVTTDAGGRFALTVEPPPASMPRGGLPADLVGAVTIAVRGLGLSGGMLRKGENTFRLARGVAVSGIVNDAQGKPVGGAMVRFTSVFSDDRSFGASVGETSLRERFSVKSGADGRWTMPDLPTEGRAFFQLDDPQYARVTAQLMLSPTPSPVPPLVARPGARIAGRVLFEDGKPAAGVAVMAQSQPQGNGGGYGTGKTGADGTYELTGLAVGPYRVTANETSGEWVAPGVEGVMTQAGQTARAADIVLSRGVLLEGTVLDADTKAPLQGAVINVQSSNGWAQSKPSDKMGRYQLRVVPGEMTFHPNQPPAGYLSPENYGNNQVTITAASKTIAPFLLKKGLTLAGTALDEAGKPAAGARLKIGGEWDNTQAEVDADGKWSILGVRPGRANRGEPEGAVALSVGGEWQIVRPTEVIKMPAPGPVAVVLRRIKLATLAGRVVTPDNKPIEGATVNIRLPFGSPGGPSGSRTEQRTTDAAGRFTLAKLRPETRPTLTVQKDGYKYLSGGAVGGEGEARNVSDTILAPLSATVAGRVVDAAGKAVAGARVMSPDGEAETAVVTDAAGRFTLGSLVEGEARVWAARGYDAGEAKGRAVNDAKTAKAVTITLAARPTPRGADGERAGAIIKSMAADANAGQRQTARELAPQLAASDPDLALQLAASGNDEVEDATRAGIILRLARSDPKRAAQWAPPQLEKIKDEAWRTRTAMSLGLAVAAVAPELGAELFGRVRATLKPNDLSDEAARLYAQLTALAARLKRPEAAGLADAVWVVAERSTDKKRLPETLGSYAGLIAVGDVALAEGLLSDLSPAERVRALENVITPLARENGAAALRLLKTMEELRARPAEPTAEVKVAANTDGEYRPPPEQLWARAATAVIKAIARTDPAAALTLARKIKSDQERPMALALAAQFQPREVAAPLLREALAATSNHWQAATMMARIAAMAHAVDPKLGEELFAQALERLNRKPNYADDDSRESAAGYAFYHAAIDPAGSRLMIETEFARRQEAAAARARAAKAAKADAPIAAPAEAEPQEDWQLLQNLSLLARAMAAVDVERALEMVEQIPDAQGYRARVRTQIISFLLAPEDKRRTMPFTDFYGEPED